MALIVEDNTLNVRYLKLIMEKFNIPYEVAYNGEEALLFTDKKKYHIIFMDIHMPIIDGFEATVAIRSNSKGINYKTPIIALSADCVQEQIDRAYDLGMNDFISKPFIPSEIERVVRKYYPDK